MIRFYYSSQSGVPAYLQIVQQVKQALQIGTLNGGDRLPTVKDVVGMMAVNPNTVAKAYRELENQGITVGVTGRGTFVQDQHQKPDQHSKQSQQNTQLANELREWLSLARAAGFSDEAIELLVKGVLHEHTTR